jgi:hypothetical protein
VRTQPHKRAQENKTLATEHSAMRNILRIRRWPHNCKLGLLRSSVSKFEKKKQYIWIVIYCVRIRIQFYLVSDYAICSGNVRLLLIWHLAAGMKWTWSLTSIKIL